MKVGVIMNPVAGGGRLRRHWPEIGAALKTAFGDFDLRETQAAGDGGDAGAWTSPPMAATW